jgi:type II secretion system (T2SS) protein G
VGLCLLLVFAGGCYLDSLPPENHTSTAMYPLKKRILRFANTHDRPPHALSELPPLEGFTNRTTDVWGNEIKYIVDGTTITLLSYGKDQRPGGNGDARDVIGIFEAKNVDGKWADGTFDESSEWKVEPLSDKK